MLLRGTAAADGGGGKGDLGDTSGDRRTRIVAARSILACVTDARTVGFLDIVPSVYRTMLEGELPRPSSEADFEFRSCESRRIRGSLNDRLDTRVGESVSDRGTIGHIGGLVTVGELSVDMTTNFSYDAGSRLGR